jgi:hypothetical protein
MYFLAMSGSQGQVDVLLARCQRRAHRVHAGDERAVTQHVQHGGPMRVMMRMFTTT